MLVMFPGRIYCQYPFEVMVYPIRVFWVYSSSTFVESRHMLDMLDKDSSDFLLVSFRLNVERVSPLVDLAESFSK